VRRAERRAEHQARQDLGALGRKVTFDWTLTPREVALHVRLDQPWRLGPGWSTPKAFAHLDRTIVIRVESAR
jgi:hypothetical protein